MIDETVLLAIAVTEFILAVIAILRRRAVEFGALFALALMLQPHTVGPVPLLVAGAAGYIGSVVWRLISLDWHRLLRLRMWLYRRGYERAMRQYPRAPIIIAGAASVTLLVPDSVSAVGLAGLVLATASTSFEWRRSPHGAPVLSLSMVASATVAVLALLIAIGGGALTWAAPSAGTEVLSQLIGVQIALGLLPLTVSTAATQFVAGAAGSGAASVLPWGRVVGALAVVLGSIACDFYLLAAPVHGGDLEGAETIAVAAVVIGLVTSTYVASYLQPVTVADALVKRVSVESLTEVSRHRQNPYQPWFGRDPFRDIERLLYLAATRDSDIRLFQHTVTELEERIRTIVRVGHLTNAHDIEVSLDEYLASVLAALLDDAARQRRGWVLESLIWFREQLSTAAAGERLPVERKPGQPFLERTHYGEPPSGAQLHGRIVDSAIEGRLPLEGLRAVYRVGRYVRDHLPALPDPTGVWQIDPEATAGFQGDAPAQHASDAIEDALAACVRWAEKAGEAKVYGIAEAAADAVASITGEARALTDARWAGWLATQGVSEAYRIADNGLRHGQLWFDVPTKHEDYTRANPAHVAVVEALSFWLPYTMGRCAPVASYMLVVNATMLALSWLDDFPEEAGAIAGALEYVKRRQQRLPAREESAMVTREVDRRLTQLRGRAGDSLAVFERTRSQFLERLIGELEAGPAPGGTEVL